MLVGSGKRDPWSERQAYTLLASTLSRNTRVWTVNLITLPKKKKSTCITPMIFCFENAELQRIMVSLSLILFRVLFQLPHCHSFSFSSSFSPSIYSLRLYHTRCVHQEYAVCVNRTRIVVLRFSRAAMFWLHLIVKCKESGISVWFEPLMRERTLKRFIFIFRST